jgi:acyl transferase domain-containing protein/aryl carrier-like protein
VGAETISCIEAHGTGTALGDPIEIAGLSEALAGNSGCAIGAVKANIGHLESAAGVAGLTKLLLQLRHRTIAPCRHAATPNTLIDFAATPFTLPQAAIPWRPAQPGGRLRAGLSSFGAGGANTHLVLEEAPPAQPRIVAAGPELILLSARDAERLRVVAGNLLAALADDMALAEIAYTLQVGRQALPARLSLHVESIAGLREGLRAWLGGNPLPGTWSGTAKAKAARAFSETGEGAARLADLLARGSLAELGALWAEGAEIDWSALKRTVRPRLLDLPTYPFRRERYWLGTSAAPLPAEPPAPPAQGSGAVQDSGASESTGQPARIQLFARAWHPAQADEWRATVPLLVLARDAALLSALAPLWPGLRVARPGSGFAVLPDGSLSLDPGSEADHASLIGYLAQSAPDDFAIVQALDWREGGMEGVRASILLTQAAQRAGVNARILHLYSGAASRPLDEAVGALARSAMQEREGCRLRAIGLDDMDAHAAARILRSELLAADDAPEVLHANGLRRARAIETTATLPDSATIDFRIGGAYLLAGGLGEVGCAIAEQLGRDYRARIAMIGRSEPRGPALERLRQLREAGLQVIYEACDVTDADGLSRAIAAIHARFGRLHGVLHLARAVEDALLVRKSTSSVARVMAAKVEGSIALDEALAGEDLDWFVLCSSLAAWLGLAGGGDYALACAFQSGFARLRQERVERGERRGRTVSICWPQWRHDRYLNDAKLRRLSAEGLQTIDARDGLRIIAQALGGDATEVAAIKGSESAMQRLSGAYRHETAPKVPSPAQGQEGEARAPAERGEFSGLDDRELAAYVAYLSALAPVPANAEPTRENAPEDIVLQVVRDFLKLPPEHFTAESEFASLGLDSIKALHVAERLQARLGVTVDPAMFYEFPVVGQFAEAVALRAAAAPAREARR